MSNFLAIVGLAIMVMAFVIISQTLKDERILKLNLSVRTTVLKMVFLAIFCSQLALILGIGPSSYSWAAFDVAVLALLSIMYHTYYKRYHNLEIEYQKTGKQFINISKDRYSEVVPGVFLRHYRKGKSVAPFENKLIEFASQFEGEALLVVFFTIKKGAKFEPHKHPVPELLFLSKGLATYYPDSKITISAGEAVLVPSGVVHDFDAMADCIGAAVLGEGVTLEDIKF